MAGASLKLKDHWQEQRLFLSRIIAAGIVVLLLAGVLVWRLVHLQILDYERFAELSQGNRFRIEPMPRHHLRPSRRGDRGEPPDLGARRRRRGNR
jgi:cell division protein FtsI/penicillin-binding protein 2